MPKSANPSRQRRDKASAVVRLLAKRKWTLATAESCTGGLIANRITDIPGASKIFHGGIVAYSNSVKEKFLGVRSSTLDRFGAVSEAAAREMALGARKKLGTDFAIATTGVAGPAGGTKSKPVGTVFIAIASRRQTVVTRKFNPLPRGQFKAATARQALQLLFDTLCS